MKDCFIYVSQIPRGGSAGQNKFEKSFIKFLLKKGDREKNYDIKIFSASMEEEKSDDARVDLIPLKSKSYSGYISHQIRLFFSLGFFLLRRRKKKVVMFIRYHDAMISPLILACIFGIRLTMRAGPVLPGLALCSKKPGLIIFNTIKFILGLFYKKASAIITVTENIKRGILETYKLNPEKIMVIPNAVDTELFFPEHSNRKKWDLPEEDFVFGFVGTIDDTQGVETIIQALGVLKKNGEKVPYLFIVGDGEYRPALELMAEKLEVSGSLFWAGNIPHDQVRSAINACDMMLAPVSIEDLKWRGSSSLKLWEYLACDKPILATEFNDFQFVEKFNLGRMVKADDIDCWAKSLAREARERNMVLQGKGEKFVAEKHSYDLVVEKFISISFGTQAN